ncbi:hypothetical protein PF002_g809 [Phytophthora fragariae]|uniref:DDE-1 domain-containing protein n=1 Tax=Phytophthora fragariae TaxID=53985 RepID=A0A6A4AKI0_9STRA|nr:hypothetical protein PF002_g809 [Phytophthora fragariae]
MLAARSHIVRKGVVLWAFMSALGLTALAFLLVVGFLPADATPRVGVTAMVTGVFGACVACAAAAVATALDGFTCALPPAWRGQGSDGKTMARTGSKTVWVKFAGKSKDRATVMLLGDSTGDRYPPFVVFKVRPSKVEERREENTKFRHGFSEGMWKNGIAQVQLELDMQVYANDKGWRNGPLTIAWLDFHFGNREPHLEPFLLLLGDFSGHWTEEVVDFASKINVTVLTIPPNSTAVCNPADAT